MSLETQTSKTELLSTTSKTENGCNLTCTTGYPPPRKAFEHPPLPSPQAPCALKSILKRKQSKPVVTSSQKALEWSDSHGLKLHEIREYTVSEQDDDLNYEEVDYQLPRRPSCCLIM